MKKYIIILLLLSTFTAPAFAEKIPLKITPAQIISTHHDETEVGDWIKFNTVNDVYVDDKLYLKKGTEIYGFVGFIQPNGWAGDCAEIRFKSFETNSPKGEKIIINYPLTISGNNIKSNDIKQYIAAVFTELIRGSEIYIEPNTKVFNIFIMK